MKTPPSEMPPCRKCGASDRYADGHCRPCAQAAVNAHRKANAEIIRAQRAEGRERNKETIRAQKAASYQRNKETAKLKQLERYALKKAEILAKNKEWADANPEKIRAHKKKWDSTHVDARLLSTHNYRNRKKTGGRLSRGLVKKLFALQRGACPCCGEPLGDDFHLDHRMPLSLGGQNVDSNMQLLRARCNLQKNAKHPVDFMQERGFLL